MLPADYDDSSASEKINFVETRSARRQRAGTFQQQSSSLTSIPAESSGKSSELGWVFHQLHNAQPFTQRIGEYRKQGEGINVVNTDPILPMPNDGGQCCNVCPLEKPAEQPLSTSFKPDLNSPLEATANGSPTNEFVEINSMLPRPHVMGSGTVCCNTCPSINYIVHGSMEPLGGVFGVGKLGGPASKVLEEPLNTNIPASKTQKQ